MKKTMIGAAACGLALGAAAGAEAPYAGQEQRAIKALSAQEVEAYRTGKGLGYAKAAELNHYPGPSHVLELAQALALTAAQKARTQAIFEAMQAQAGALGKQLVAQEQALDRQFATGEIRAAALDARTAQIGALQAKIRFVHLDAHLQQKRVLSPQQVRRYDQLRGYEAPQGSGHDHVD